MPKPKIIKGDPLRAYIHWGGRLRHVYIRGSYDQTTMLGETIRMLYFKLTKTSKELLAAEKSKFHKQKPAERGGRKGVLGMIALSRVRSLEGLYLVGMNEQALMMNQQIAKYDKELKR